MLPSEHSIWDELRREAARVQVPTNMWDQINQRLDEDQKTEQNRRAWFQRLAQWKPSYATAAAAAVFLFIMMPVGGKAPAPAANQIPTASLLAPIHPDEWGAGARARARAGYTVGGQVDQPGSTHLLYAVQIHS